MTNQTRPYTDDDLRAEAARQHALSVEDPDFMGIGERMEWTPIPSRPNDRWDDLDREDFGKAQRAIDDLLGKAADVSEWAINLGADGLEPDGHQLTWSAGEQPIVRVHFAFHPGMRPESRDYLVTAVGEALGSELARATAAASAAGESGSTR